MCVHEGDLDPVVDEEHGEAVSIRVDLAHNDVQLDRVDTALLVHRLDEVENPQGRKEPLAVGSFGGSVHFVFFGRHQTAVHQVILGGESLEGANGDAGPGDRGLEAGPTSDGLTNSLVLQAGQTHSQSHHHLVGPADPVELLPPTH